MSNRRKFGNKNKSKAARQADPTPVIAEDSLPSNSLEQAGTGVKPITKDEIEKSHEFRARTVYDRARWKNGMRVFGVVLMVLLNISLVGSDVERAQKMAHFSLLPEVITFGCLLLMDVTVLMPLIFEVDTIELYQDSLVLRLLFWKAKLKWEDIQYFKLPPMLKFAVVRSQKCFYLINRRDIRNFSQLAESIKKHELEFKPKLKA
ncbi:MAG TPA: hypothetical protein V6C76_01245 [Drouetiella sp.]